MPVLFLTTPGARATLVSERLRIEFPPENGASETPPSRDVPLHDVEQVVLDERAHITTPAVCECLRREIPIFYLTRSHAVLGLAQPPAPATIVRRIQHRRAEDAGFTLAIAAVLAEAKVQNCRRVLQRIASNRNGSAIRESVGAAIEGLEHLRRQCLVAASTAVLRGYEGAAAARYFEALASFFPVECPFPGRSRRPPLDPPNAVLSFGYSLLAAEVEGLIHSAGLDPTLAFLHAEDEGRPSLALDLMEPFRPVIADALALDLLGHRVLQPREHFERRDGGVFLNTDGRRRFFTAFERRLEREFTSEQHGQRTSLRRELRRQVNNLKRALVDNEPFVPFLMN